MRLIDADALERNGWSLHRTYKQDEKTMVYEIKKPSDFPAIEERKKGHIEILAINPFDGEDCYCSECGTNKLLPSYKFCVECGCEFIGVRQEREEREEKT